jgi:thioredoxin reductase (NADPH)
LGFGGPVLIGSVASPEVTRLSGLLGRTGIPFRVIDPDQDAEASSLLARFAPNPGELPIVVVPDGTVLKNPTKQALARALGLVATTLRTTWPSLAPVQPAWRLRCTGRPRASRSWSSKR